MFEDLIARHRGLVFAFNSLRPACSWLGIDHSDAERSLATFARYCGTVPDRAHRVRPMPARRETSLQCTVAKSSGMSCDHAA